MKYLLIASSLLVTLTPPALAQGTTTTTATPPNSMGRWGEFRARQIELRRLDNERQLRAAEPKQSTLPAGFEDKQATLADFADCAIAQAPERTAELLATTPGTREEGQALRKFVSLDSCTRGRSFVSARTGEMRGALAEAALLRDAARLAALAARVGVTPARISETAAGTRPFVIAYGQCIAGAAPSQSVALIATPHGSDDEKRAMLAIGEPLKACMPEGVAYSLNIRDVRNHVADALYRMSAGA